MTATRTGAGTVDVTLPGGVVPLDAVAMPRSATAQAVSTQISGQVVTVHTGIESDFTLWVF